jgi:hypothetical protein
MSMNNWLQYIDDRHGGYARAVFHLVISDIFPGETGMCQKMSPPTKREKGVSV